MNRTEAKRIQDVIVKAGKDPKMLAAIAKAKQTKKFSVGDRVLVTRGYAKGLESKVTGFEPDLVHSVTLLPGHGRARPDMLEIIDLPLDAVSINEQTASIQKSNHWIELVYKTINGKRYGPYKLKRWRDENGKKRSQYIGKTPKQEAPVAY